MPTLLFFFGLLMALNDTTPHRTAPETRQAADASAVAVRRQQFAHAAALAHLLKHMLVAPAVSQAAGRGYADSLAALVGGQPEEITADVQGSDVGDYWPHVNQMAVAPTTYYGTKRTKPEVRASMAHEFGHIFELLRPGLRAEFLKRNPDFPAHAAWSGAGNTGYTGETIADAFAQAVRKVVPKVGEENAYNYSFSPDLINARQQALLDSLVQARQKYLPR